MPTLARRKLRTLTALALAALLVALATIGVEAQLASHPPSVGGAQLATGTSPATATFAPTQTPPVSATPVNLAALGWVKRTLSWVERVATAPSSTNTIYACGGQPHQNGWTVGFAVSQDSGHTWTTLGATLQAAHCNQIFVSPSAPQAVAVYTDSCPAECGLDVPLIFYTLDSGAHWSPISHPCSCDSPNGDRPAFGWVGTTLFATPGTPTPTGSQQLAKSTDGGAFTWLSLGVTPQQLFTTADTVYAVNGSDLYKSTDLGASWSKTSPTYNGAPVAVLAMAPGAALLGVDARWSNPAPNTYPLLRSADGGATWQQTPSLPDGVQINANVLETPDGSVYLTAVGQAAGQGGIYKLASGASQWRLLSAVLPGNLDLVSVTWNASGQPLTLWGLAPQGPTGIDDPSRILYSHAA